ncbi:MAG TPA: helix-turn-helix transcriptional regulator [Clostridiales bacterium]|nr:helix-turn-helix transcriptional regulator [Clostridiales bacterium]
MVINKEKFEVCMAEKCMTYDDLAKKANLSRFTIQKMLGNKVDTRPATVGKIAKALGVNVKELIDFEAATSNQFITNSGVRG